MSSQVSERPFLAIQSPGHIDRFGERLPDKWAVVRAGSGRIVELFVTEPEAREFASEQNAVLLLRRR